MAMPIWRRFDRQEMLCARRHAMDSAGSKIDMSTAMMPMTTSSSTRVKPRGGRHLGTVGGRCGIVRSFTCRRSGAASACQCDQGDWCEYPKHHRFRHGCQTDVVDVPVSAHIGEIHS